MNSRLWTVAASLVFSALLLSCAGRGSDFRVHDIDYRGWAGSDPIYLYYDNTDTVSARQLYLLLRLTGSIPYSALRMEVETLSPAGIFWCDTVSLVAPAADGPGTFNDLRVLYRSGVRLGEAGNYRFRFRQLSSDTLLRGIAGLGIEVNREGHPWARTK
ncbi:MAG: gliding motility lipoprotein GldH [Rikenellaceae bacterium]|jgi:gliding motility-associated lipoprotein GldH|nr:gliding motility lipoprotein GldH [Rikenellaceae bacterium]